MESTIQQRTSSSNTLVTVDDNQGFLSSNLLDLCNQSASNSNNKNILMTQSDDNIQHHNIQKIIRKQSHDNYNNDNRYVTSKFNDPIPNDMQQQIDEIETEDFKTCYNQSKRLDGNNHNNQATIMNASATTKHTNNFQQNISTTLSRIIETPVNINDENSLIQRFNQLTIYNKERHESIQGFVDSLRRLEDLGIFKNVGTDCVGTQYYMLFGYKYPSDSKQRLQVTKDVVYLLNFISSRYNFSLIFFYTNLRRLAKEPASTLRQMYSRLSAENKRRLQSINLIHPSWYVRMRIRFISSCGGNNQNYLRRVRFYKSLAEYLGQIKQESSLIQRIVGSLPHEIHQIYLSEKQTMKQQSPKKVKQKKQNMDISVNSETMKQALLQGFTKEVLERGDEQYMNFNISSAIQTIDVLGRHIYEFQRQRSSNIPDIFILLVTFFEINPHLLKTEGLFRIAASMDKLDELQIHLQMGNYYVLTQMVDEPHAVSNYLKKVFKCMGEPLCTYKLYSRFRDLSDVKIEQRADKLKEICKLLPTVNKYVFVYLIKFLHKVVEYHEINKMSLHNIAIVITPNLFRPFELTANDLIFASHLVESFKVMMLNYEYIFDIPDLKSAADYGAGNKRSNIGNDLNQPSFLQ